MLVHSPTDHVSDVQRILWLQPLLELRAPLLLYVDTHYLPLVLGCKLPASAQILPLDLSSLEIVQTIRGRAGLALPPLRTPAKDTLEFMTIMNSKSEVLAAAAARAKTPYVAYIDAGISKILKNPETLKTLDTLAVKDIPLLCIPGCWPVAPVQPTFPRLWRQIHWMVCGGFFIVARERAHEWAGLHAAALRRFLDLGCITWEVNVWASLIPTLEGVVWFAADHNDTMLTGIPLANKIQGEPVTPPAITSGPP